MGSMEKGLDPKRVLFVCGLLILCATQIVHVVPSKHPSITKYWSINVSFLIKSFEQKYAMVDLTPNLLQVRAKEKLCAYRVKDISSPERIYIHDTLVVTLLLEQKYSLKEILSDYSPNFGKMRVTNTFANQTCYAALKLHDNAFSFSGQNTTLIELKSRALDPTPYREFRVFIQPEKVGIKFLAFDLSLSSDKKSDVMGVLDSYPLSLYTNADTHTANSERQIEVMDNILGIPASMSQIASIATVIFGSILTFPFLFNFIKTRQKSRSERVPIGRARPQKSSS